MSEALITIVIPVYNVEKYLDKCIESIVNQTYRNLEIILVDDGSKDTSPQLCDSWQEKDLRIKVIHKKNEGAGIARNIGIENAKGRYICFFDSDDYIDKYLIEKAYNIIEEQKCDIAIYGMKKFDSNGNVIDIKIPRTEKKYYYGNDVQELFLPELIDYSNIDSKSEGLLLSFWSCMFSVELIKRCNWKIVSEREFISEDSFSLIRLYKYVEAVAILPEALYNYRINQTSISHTLKDDDIKKLKHFYIQSLLLAEKMSNEAEIKKRIATLSFSLAIGIIKKIVVSDMNFNEKIKSIKNMLGDNIVNELVKNSAVKYKSKSKGIFRLAMLYKLKFTVYLLASLQMYKKHFN